MNFWILVDFSVSPFIHYIHFIDDVILLVCRGTLNYTVRKKNFLIQFFFLNYFEFWICLISLIYWLVSLETLILNELDCCFIWVLRNFIFYQTWLLVRNFFLTSDFIGLGWYFEFLWFTFKNAWLLICLSFKIPKLDTSLIEFWKFTF